MKTEEELGRISNERTRMGFVDILRAAEDWDMWKGIVGMCSVLHRRLLMLKGCDEIRK